ncbi:uncharacterized protein LOC116144759 [Pistacia vera]|uniref:uncharacterized protein LOC116144759 n=1 Tax=Pistacia vera TaxID=55513 RepID=UPI001262D1AA|nr:uncharacterized protein LOC116144759 [Pistacia vera]
MVEIASFVLDIVKCLAAPIGRQFMYLYNYKKNIDNLQDEVKNLKNTSEEVQVKVVAAEINVEEIKQSVKDWQTKVNNTITEAEKLIEEKENNPRCFKGLCPNCITQYKHSKKAFKLKRDDIVPLLLQEERFDTISYSSIQSNYEKNFDKLRDDVSKLKNARSKVQRMVEKAEKNVEEIEEDVKKWLEDVDSIIVKAAELIENQSSVGTDWETRYRNSKAASELMVDNIGPLLQQGERFDKASHPTIHKEIWLRSNEDYLAFESRNSTVKNVLDTLHDEEIDMVGVYGMGGLGKTTLVQEIGRKAEKDKLFDEIVFVEVTETPDTKKIQTIIANKLRLKFEDAMEDENQRANKLYSRMEKKNILLIVDNIWEELTLEKIGIPFGADRGRSKILMTTRNVDVLEKMGSTTNFKMGILNEEEAWRLFKKMTGNVIQTPGLNSLPKDVCKECGDYHVLTERNDIEREWKDKDKLRKCTIVSLVGNNIITQLWPEALDCPKLEFLRGSSFEIPKEFFTVMPKLKVLNLFGIQQSLLSSLDLLTNLQTLYLDDSEIEDIAIIGKLKKLKVLSLRNTNIEELSTEMGQLTGLKILDLSNCWQLKVIAPNVISKLSQLEELYIKGCSIQWKVEVLEELKHLSQLTSLEIYIKDKKMMPKDFYSRELKRCNISIEDELFDDYDWYQFSRIFKFQYDFTISLEELRILKNVELLRLVGSRRDDNNLKPLFNEKVFFTNLMALELKNISSGKIWDNQFPTLLSSSYQNLTHFILKSCRKIKYVFPSSIAKSLQTLQHLQTMDCKILEEIVAEEEGAKVAVNFAFPQVTNLRLEKLPNLIAFYPGIHTYELSMLKRLVIKECEKFTSKYLSFQENSFQIPEPKSLCLAHKINSNLEDLNLKNKLRQIRWRSRFKTLEIEDDESTNIPLGLLQRFENLEVLQLAWCRYEEMFSCGKDEKHMQITLLTSFQNLKVLNVSQCRELMKLMTHSMAKSLVQLRELSVEGCETMIEIVENEGDATTSIEIAFDNLKKLSLKDLKSLICFCFGNYSFNFSSLEELIIRECPNMKTFSQGILSTPKLHKVNYEGFNETNMKWEKIKEVENEGNDLNKSIQGAYKIQDISLDLKYKAFKDVNSTEICYNQHPNFFYESLTHLFLWNCGNIKYAFPSSIAKSLHQLQQLKIQNCKALEEIVAKEEGANAVVNFFFPHVTSLKLEDLPELTTFYLGIHTFEWPMLKELVVKNCDKFTSKHMSFQENSEEGELHISKPKSIFLDDKINQDLEVFELRNDMKRIIWQSGSKTFEISYDNLTNIPLGLLQRFENLKELKLDMCDMKELKLYRCDQYKELFFPNFQNLEVLEVHRCSKLMSLMPFLASFQNLNVLRVSNSNGLMKLITPSTARNLVQLREMTVMNCGMLIEIVENEGEQDATTSIEIVFDNLKKLSLVNLQSLTCFCSGNYSFKFPSLEKLIIRFCPNMKTFSQGILSTPKLYKVDYMSLNMTKRVPKEMKVENKENDLNTTIQQAHQKEIVQISVKDSKKEFESFSSIGN